MVLPSRKNGESKLFEKTKHLVLEDEVLLTEPCETRMSTGFTPMYASTARSVKGGRFNFNFASVMNETPRSCKSFATLPMLPKGDDESINEESSYESV